VAGTCAATRGSLLQNTAVLPIEVDPADGTVTLEGRVLGVDPVSEVRLSRRYLLA
jgi:urease alpha subunit